MHTNSCIEFSLHTASAQARPKSTLRHGKTRLRITLIKVNRKKQIIRIIEMEYHGTLPKVKNHTPVSAVYLAT